MNFLHDLWNWRRNARDREERLQVLENWMIGEENFQRCLYQLRQREQTRMRQMG